MSITAESPQRWLSNRVIAAFGSPYISAPHEQGKIPRVGVAERQTSLASNTSEWHYLEGTKATFRDSQDTEAAGTGGPPDWRGSTRRVSTQTPAERCGDPAGEEKAGAGRRAVFLVDSG